MAVRMQGVIGADSEERFNRKTSIDVREFVTDEGEDDDWAPVIQAAIDVAAPNLDRVELPAMTRFVNSPLTINDPIEIAGVPHATRLIAGVDLAGFMINATTASGHPTEGQHLPALRLSGLFLDGKGRTVDAGGVSLSKVQRCVVSDVKIRHFTRAGMYFPLSVRNSRFENLWMKHNGDGFNGWAQLQIENGTDSPDSANLKVFSGCDFIYPAGYNLWIKSDRANSQVRQHWFIGCTFHSAPPTFSSESIDGYTITLDDRWLASGIVVQNATSVHFSGCDLEYASNGFPQISIQNNTDYPQTTSNGAVIENCLFGSQDLQEVVATGVDATTNRLAFTNHRFPTCAVVRVASTGTLPGGLAASTDYYARRVSATEITLHTTWEDTRKNTSAVDITSTGSGTLTVTSQQIAVLADRIGYLYVGAKWNGSTNRPKVVNKHAADRVRLDGQMRTGGNAVDVYEGPDATDLLGDWIGGDIRANAIRLTSPNGTSWRVAVGNDGSLSTTAL